MEVESVRGVAAQLNATAARLAMLAADLDEEGGWAEDGMRSCSHWLTINTGLGVGACVELIRCGRALRGLPRIWREFSSGRLSLDKVRWLTLVATPEDEEGWAELGLLTSGSQLVRICRAFQSVLTPGHQLSAEEQMARRHLHMSWDEEGMLRLRGRLTAEDGAILKAAVSGLALGAVPPAGAPVGDPAAEPIEARLADALVHICEHSEGEAAERRVVVHVDAGALGGEAGGGRRSHLEDGPGVGEADVRLIGCDAEVVRVTEREGLPIDAGRSRRLVSQRLRLALHARDGGCRFPGCGAPADRTQAHHVRHWADGGRTDLGNLCLLCRFHHRRLHQGAFAIRRRRGRFEFLDRREAIIDRPLRPARPPWIPAPGSPVADEYGARMNTGYITDVMCDHRAFLESTART